MSVDEQGFDPDQDYTKVDNPFWDCTDGAHPAWWRGEEYSIKMMIKKVNEWLDEPIDKLTAGSYGYPDLQGLKERIIDLRRKALPSSAVAS